MLRIHDDFAEKSRERCAGLCPESGVARQDSAWETVLKRRAAASPASSCPSALLQRLVGWDLHFSADSAPALAQWSDTADINGAAATYLL